MLKFTTLYLEGFGSIIKPFTFKYKKGLNIINGINGVGKTTSMNGLYWTITGDTLKPGSSIPTWEHLRPKDWKGTMGRIEFEKNGIFYLIVRFNEFKDKYDGIRGDNRLLLYINGKNRTQKTKKLTQDKINSIIGYSPDLFKNSIIFGQKLKRLIDEPGSNKKKILEEAFDILYINNAKSIADNEKKNLLSLITQYENKVEVNKTKIAGYQLSLKEAQSTQDNFNLINQRQILKIKNEVKAFIDAKHDISEEKLELLSDFDKLNKHIKHHSLSLRILRLKETYGITSSNRNSILQSYQYKLKENALEISQIKKRINQLVKNIRNDKLICSKCKQPITGELKEEIINGYVSKLKKARKENKNLHINQESLNIKIKKLGKALELLNRCDNYEDKEKHNDYCDSQVKKLKAQMLEIKNQKLQNNIPQLTRKINILSKLNKPNQLKLKKLYKRLKIYEWLIKDPLSNNGLKIYIFNSMIQAINERMAYYSRFYGFTQEFNIGLDSARKDIDLFIYKDDNVVNHKDLSGGESQLSSVITAFSIHDVLNTGDKLCNILILDEIFESLSDDNIEKISEIINEKVEKGLAIYLITHLKKFNPINSKRIIFTKNNQNNTTLQS